MTTPTPTPYPTEVPPSGQSWSPNANHCVSQTPMPTATATDGTVSYAPGTLDCSVSGYGLVPAQATPTVTATVTAQPTATATVQDTAYPGGYNSSDTNYGNWTNYIAYGVSGFLFVALMVYCVGHLVRWAKMALNGGNGALD